MYPHKRADLPPLPDCANVCITNQSTIDSQRQGGCGFTETVCQCGSSAYLQPLYDCLAATCNHTDSIASYNYGDAICASVGTSVLSGLSTQDPRSTSSVASSTSLSSSTTSPLLSSTTPATNESAVSSTPSASPSPNLSGIPSPTHLFSTSADFTDISPSSSQPLLDQTTGPTSNTAVIAGGLVAGIVVLALLLFALWLLRRRNQLQKSPNSMALTDRSPYGGLINKGGHALDSTAKQPHIITTVSEQPYPTPEFRMRSSEDDNEPQQRPASTVLTETTDFPPPAYQPSATGDWVTGDRMEGSPNPFTSILESPDDAIDATFYNTDIRSFCAANRDLVSPALESKLRAAHWIPTDDPSEIPAEHWSTAYGVEFFELKRIQEAYDRSNSNGERLNKEGSHR